MASYRHSGHLQLAQTPLPCASRILVAARIVIPNAGGLALIQVALPAATASAPEAWIIGPEPFVARILPDAIVSDHALTTREFLLFVPADALLSIEPFENELRRRCAQRIRAAHPHAKLRRKLEQFRHPAQLFQQRLRFHSLIQAQCAAQIEPLHHLPQIDAVKMRMEDFRHRYANNLARHGIAALQFALIFELELSRNRR